MRKSFFFLLTLMLLFTAAHCAAEDIAPPETPAPARIHIAPEPSPEPPMVHNATKDSSCLDGLRFRLDAQFLHVWFPIIANADEAIITFGDEVWLIDCGDKAMGLRGVRLLQELGITKIDKLFNSHPHHDHLNGLQVTNEAVPVSELLVCFPEDSTDSIMNAVAYAETEKIPVTQYQDGDVFTMGDGRVSLKFFLPDDPTLDMNNLGSVTLLQYGSRRMLFMADMERPGQAALLAQHKPEELRAEVLKYPHHGKTGLLEEFFEALQPSFAVITNVRVNWGGVDYLTWKKTPHVFTCASDHYIHLYTDGNTWVAERVPMGFSGR